MKTERKTCSTNIRLPLSLFQRAEKMHEISRVPKNTMYILGLELYLAREEEKELLMENHKKNISDESGNKKAPGTSAKGAR